MVTTPTIITARDFNQDLGKAKRAALQGPVIVTDRGAPSHVLLSIEDYRRLTHAERSVAEMLAMPEGATIDLDAVLPDRTSDRSRGAAFE